MVLLQEHKVDIALISETWFTDPTNSSTATIKSYGYSTVHDFRTATRGGGTAIICSSPLQFSVCNINIDTPPTTFEYTTATLKCAADMKVLIVSIYRTGTITKQFYSELNLFLQHVVMRNDYIIVGGDFNIHIETENAYSCDLLDVMESYGFMQLVDPVNPTHNQGGTIDLLFDNSNLLSLQCNSE